MSLKTGPFSRIDHVLVPFHGPIRQLPGGQQITLDSNGATRATAITLSADAWRLKRPGIGPATTPPAWAAQGHEWRNEALQPNETLGGRVFFDEGGEAWLITNQTVTVTAGNLALSAQVRPYGALGLATDFSTPKTLTANIATPGLTTDGAMRLLSINETGRKQLWALQSLTNAMLCPERLYGVVEVEFSGNASYDLNNWPASLTGLSLGATVLKSKTDCDWTHTTISNSSSGSLPTVPGPYSYSLTCSQEVHSERLFHAWYTPAGGIEYLHMLRGWLYSGTADESGTATAGMSLQASSWSGSFDRTFWHEISGDANTLTSAIAHHALTYSGTNTPQGDGFVVQHEDSTETCTLGGATVATYSAVLDVPDSDPAGGGAHPLSCTPTVNEEANLGDSAPHGTPSAPQVVWLNYAPARHSNNLFSMLNAASEPLSSGSGSGVALCNFGGYLHPAGTVAGGPSPGSFGINGSAWVCTPTFRYGTWNPYSQTAYVLEQYPVGVV